MDITIINIDQDVDEKRLREALATRLHRPPFRRRFDEPPINFDVHVHLNEGEERAEWQVHRGTASFTVPEYWQGKMFLEQYGEGGGFPLMGKKLHFSKSERRPAEGLIEALRRLPWLGPEEMARRETLLQKLSRSIVVRQIDFGRPCRDGVFSVEHSIEFGLSRARLTFDASFTLVRIATLSQVMTFRCDSVAEVVADERANAILVVLKMPPSFEEMAKLGAPGDPEDLLDERQNLASKIPEVMPPPTKSTRPPPSVATDSDPTKQLAAPVAGASKQQATGGPDWSKPQAANAVSAKQPAHKSGKNAKSAASSRYIPGMKKPPSPGNSRTVPGLHKQERVRDKVVGWGDVPIPSPQPLQPTSDTPKAPLETPIVAGLPPLGMRPPREQTAYARAVGRGGHSSPEEELRWPVGIVPRYINGATPDPPLMTREGSSSTSGGEASSTHRLTTDGDSPPSELEEVEDMSLGVKETNWREQPTMPLPKKKGLRLRTPRFDEKHKNTAPFTSKTFRIVFGQADAILSFEENAELSWTGFPPATRAQVKVEARHLYSHKNRSRIPLWLKTLPICLGMQLDALYTNSVLDPLEMSTLQKPVDKYLDRMRAEILAHAIMLLGENVAQDDAAAGIWGAKIDLNAMLELAVDRVKDERTILPIHSYMVKTFHLYITPTAMILEGPYASETNRIVRRYQERTDSFLRVTFCDESRREYRWERNIDWPAFLRQRVGKVLLDGVIIAGRTFEFLGYSMSSLRMRSAWFVTPFEQGDHQISAESIRYGLGDFSKVINAPSRYGARIAQAFTATRPSLRLRPDQIRREPDIMDDNGHCFTDGAARLSPQLAREILQAVGDAFGPSPYEESYAFQFRLGGAKGVAAIDTNLADEGSVIYLRPSTEKFDAPTSLDFEVVLIIWQCRPLTLNQDIIQILENRGVSADVFLRLQLQALESAKAKRSSLSGAAGLLTYNEFGEAFDVPVLLQRLSRLLPHDEFETFASECEGGGAFLQHCLRNAFSTVCRNLKYKARLPVPGGCLVVGTADETQTLEERQIYCCVTPFGGYAKYYKGPVLVFRSPAVHPGDAQILTAIGEPPAEQKAFFEARRNQIVFSVKGTRPLASELGGGDLDGDPFGITDYADLFPTQDYEPAEYPPVKPMRLDRDAVWKDVVDWVVTYIGSDVLGLLGSRRRLIADQCRSGTKHPRSLKLAELYTAAVDAPKSGILPPLDEIPRRLFGLTPDFMQPEDLHQAQRDSMKLRDYYESPNALGKLFRAIPRTITNREPWTPPILPTEEDGTDPDDADFAIDEPVTNALRFALTSVGLPCGNPSVADLAFAGRLMARYALELRHISLANSLISHPGRGLSEAELVMGLIAGATPASGSKQKDVVEKASIQAAELVRSIRKQLVEPLVVKVPPLSKPAVQDQPTSISTEQPMSTGDAQSAGIDGTGMGETERHEAERDQSRRAWAAWCVATRAPTEKFGCRSFGLVALGAVMDAIEAANERKKAKVVLQLKEQVEASARSAVAVRRPIQGKQRLYELLGVEDLEVQGEQPDESLYE